MQTISTSLTSRRGVLIENLTAVSRDNAPIPHDLEAPMYARYEAKRELDKPFANYGTEHVEVKFQDPQERFSYKKVNAVILSPPIGIDVPVLAPVIHGATSSPPSPLVILYGGEIELSKMQAELEVLEANGEPIKVVSTTKDLEKSSNPMTYIANSVQEMVELINGATSKNIPVHFLGIGLIDTTKSGNWSETEYSKDCDYYLMRTEVQTMIRRIMNEAERKHSQDADAAPPMNEGKEALLVETSPSPRQLNLKPFKNQDGQMVSLPRCCVFSKEEDKKESGTFLVKSKHDQSRSMLWQLICGNLTTEDPIESRNRADYQDCYPMPYRPPQCHTFF